ncbi:MAG: hypothetical protein OHK0029_28660 [Armatimonadaceae bacterium]
MAAERAASKEGKACSLSNFPAKMLRRNPLFTALVPLVGVTAISLCLYHLTGGQSAFAPPASAAITTTSVQGASPAMQKSVTDFLDSLRPALREKAMLPFDNEERLNWHFVPKARQGVRLDDLDTWQRQKVQELLRASLSASGYESIEKIRALEEVLREMEGRQDGNFRNPLHYYVTVFGTPSANGVWGWRYEGHHISLNWTVVKGAVIATTPQFIGVNPAEVRIPGAYKGLRVLAAEEDLARRLVRSLSQDQRKTALLSDKAPNDILTGAEREVRSLEDRGLPYAEMTDEQKALLVSLLTEHTRVQPERIARERLQKVRDAGLEKVRFAWMGGLEPGQGHYYRLQGPTFLVEYDNTQNDANHIHTVWRDFNGDFGRDILAEHYRAAHHDGSEQDVSGQVVESVEDEE